jgi:hypothetical protein
LEEFVLDSHDLKEVGRLVTSVCERAGLEIHPQNKSQIALALQGYRIRLKSLERDRMVVFRDGFNKPLTIALGRGGHAIAANA